MRFAIYSRKSKQTLKGESIENQILICKKYIKSNFFGEHSIQVFSEEGVSAKNNQRPAFQNMLQMAKQKQLDYIVCYRLDRISRNVGDFAALVEQLSQYHTDFICVKEQFDTKTPTGRAMMYMASVFAQLERETIAERVRDNMFYLAKRGYWLGGTTPLGFSAQKTMAEGKCFSGLVQNSSEIWIVEKIYMLFLECCSISAVKRQLEKEKIFSRQNNPFSLTALKDILTNPVYCSADEKIREYFCDCKATVTFEKEQCSDIYGLLVYNKRNYAKKSAPRQKIENWIVAKARHEAVISGEQWLQVQSILNRNQRKQKQHKTENTYALLSGILYCQKCGEKMQAKKRRNQQKTITFDYICKGKLQKKCDIQNLLGKETDEKTEQFLLDYILKQCCFDDVWKAYQNKFQKTELLKYQRGILECQKQIEKYMMLLEQQNINATLIEEIDKRWEQLQEQQNVYRQKETYLKEQQEFLKQHMPSFLSLWQKLSMVQKQEAIRFLIQKGVWNGKEIYYYL